MYQLGEQFKLDFTKAISNPKNIIKGSKYRITVLTERLIRFEYNENGIFLDKPTELVWFRNTAPVNFKKSENSHLLQIETKYVRITYSKEKPYKGSKINPSSNLKVELLNTNRIWYYGHPEVRNFNSPGLTLQDKKGKMLKEKGLYSLDGFVSIDDSKNNMIDESGVIVPRENNGIDIYLFAYLRDFAYCLTDYYTITGYPPLIPRYALGNWWMRNNPYYQNEIINLVDNFAKNEIPLSILVLDKDWHIRKYNQKLLRTGFSFNSNYLENPKNLISYIKGKNIKLGLSVDPKEGLYPIDPIYQEAIKYLTPDSNGIIPFNMLNPRFVDIYLKFYLHPLENMGVDFFWIDYNGDYKNLFMLQHYQYFDMKRLNIRPLILSLNSTIAPHRYPVMYSGKTIVSWETLRQIPLYNCLATNNGVSFCSHDIGGYHFGVEDNELYTRFVQLGVFSPIMKFGCDEGKYYKREPWRWSVKTCEIVKDYLQLRHKMIPYLYTEAYKFSRYGIPLLQPLYYKYPRFYDDMLFKYEYYFGSQIFIAPIMTKKDYVMDRVIHKFFVPEGIWYDFITGKKFVGNKRYVSFYKDQDYPVFVIAGAIIPLNLENSNDTNPPKKLEIQVFPGKSNSYDLYEDDGITENYRLGKYLITRIQYQYKKDDYSLLIKPIEANEYIVKKRDYKIRFRNTTRINEVQVFVNQVSYNFKSYEDDKDFVVEINDVDTSSSVLINCKGQNVELEAVRLISDDFVGIISDLQIPTELKEKIDAILFGDDPIAKKRIQIRKLTTKGLERKFVDLFLKLIEYLREI